MITLTGILRQAGEMTIKEKPLTKLWVEHETPRENGASDLKIEELFLEKTAGQILPKQGEKIHLNVRVYPDGRNVKFQVLGILNATLAKP